ncbi:MAG: hypothetical protein AAF901_13480 [Bacteroidota bacterium]
MDVFSTVEPGSILKNLACSDDSRILCVSGCYISSAHNKKGMLLEDGDTVDLKRKTVEAKNILEESLCSGNFTIPDYDQPLAVRRH